MYLIQRYSNKARITSDNANSVSRFLDGDYMGSSEFEWGAVPRAWKYLRNNPLVLTEVVTDVSIRGVITPISVWLISRTEMIDSATIDLKTKVMNRDYNGFKEDPRLIERFFAEKDAILDPSFYEKTTAWLVVDSTRDSDRIPVKDDNSPVFFCLDKSIAIRTFMELRRNTTVEKEFRLFDPVYTIAHKGQGKVAGILEDGTIVFKQHDRKIRLHPNDVYHLNEVPEGLFD